MEDNPVEPQAAMKVAELMSGAWKSRAIHAAAMLRLADLLKERPLRLCELAERSGCHAASLLRLLRALASIGIFEEQAPGLFATTGLGRCLESNAMRDVTLMMHADWHDAAWGELVHALRTGESGFAKAHGKDLFSWLASHAEGAELFSRAMTSGRAHREVGVAAACDLSQAKLVVDVGGGHGSLLLSLLEANPHIKGMLCDLPHVASEAQRQIEKAGMQERCSAVGADFFRDVPRGGDAYVLAHVIHDWSDEASGRILGNCASAMVPEGRIWLVENILPANNSPSRAQWLDLEMLVMTPGGRERTERDFGELAASSGLTLISVRPTEGSRAVIELKRSTEG